MTSRFGYLDDLLDQEWNLISQFVELKTSLHGRNSLHSRRQMLNAIFYLLRTGCD
jgi:transposase